MDPKFCFDPFLIFVVVACVRFLLAGSWPGLAVEGGEWGLLLCLVQLQSGSVPSLGLPP